MGWWVGGLDQVAAGVMQHRLDDRPHHHRWLRTPDSSPLDIRAGDGHIVHREQGARDAVLDQCGLEHPPSRIYVSGSCNNPKPSGSFAPTTVVQLPCPEHCVFPVRLRATLARPIGSCPEAWRCSSETCALPAEPLVHRNRGSRPDRHRDFGLMLSGDAELVERVLDDREAFHARKPSDRRVDLASTFTALWPAH